MKRIKPTENAMHWPRAATSSVECRKRDLIVRISDWRRDKYEPGYDVEVYIGGVYDWDESKHFKAKAEAALFAGNQIARLL
jgi:hypothetical protein